MCAVWRCSVVLIARGDALSLPQLLLVARSTTMIYRRDAMPVQRGFAGARHDRLATTNVLHASGAGGGKRRVHDVIL